MSSSIALISLPPLLPPSTNKDHHHISARFQNPWPSYSPENATFKKAFQAKFSPSKPAFVPVPEDREGLPSVLKPDLGVGGGRDGFRATWLGHASFLLEASSTSAGIGRGIRILCDPVWSERTSPVQWMGPKRYSRVPCELGEVCEEGGVDVVVISHDHYDHLDAASIREIHARRGEDVVFLVGLGMKSWFEAVGVRSEQVREMDWWDGVEVRVKGEGEGEGVEGGVKVYCTPSQHFSGRGLFDRGKTLWCSWSFVETSSSENGVAKRCYFAGDTGYRSWSKEDMSPDELNELPRCPAFKQIGEHLGPFDLALLPIGLCTPKTFMSSVHCNPWDTVEVHKDIKSKKSVGMHYGTVRGGISQDYEDVTLPAKWWKQASEEAGLKWGEETLLIDIGETIVV